MREDGLRELLREEPVPAAAEAERRGLALAERAFVQRQPEPRRARPRLAPALAIASLLAALVLTPAGAAVRDWVGDVLVDPGVREDERGLSRIPGGGRLLVQSAEGPWVVQPDGARRLLGDYDDAGWSPRGLYLAVAAGRTLSAVEPDGTPRWSLPAPGRVRDPRWAPLSPAGAPIAYRSGSQLRLVAGDGTEDRLLDGAVAPLAPTWAPSGVPLLAFADATGRVRLVATDGPLARPAGEAASVKALPGIAALEWSPAGNALLEASPQALRLRTVALHKLDPGIELGRARRLPLPPGATLVSAAFSPGGDSVAALLRLPAGPGGRAGGGIAGPRSEIVLVDLRDLSTRRLFAVTGRLVGLTWSPRGDRLLAPWPEADQWLFVPVPTGPTDRLAPGLIHAVGGVAAEFAPGAHLLARFPRVEGWCCRAR